MTDKQQFSNIWDAIEDTPQQTASMRARSELMMNLTEVIRESGASPKGACQKFCVEGTACLSAQIYGLGSPAHRADNRPSSPRALLSECGSQKLSPSLIGCAFLPVTRS
jgi:hypothetical protein